MIVMYRRTPSPMKLTALLYQRKVLFVKNFLLVIGLCTIRISKTTL